MKQQRKKIFFAFYLLFYSLIRIFATLNNKKLTL